MNEAANDRLYNPYSLARILILLLAGAFVGLMVDIRIEHVEVVHEQPIAWLPILYSAFMTIACLVAFIFWNKTARRAMLPLFLLAILVGSLGFYFHNNGDLKKVIATSFRAWTDPKMEHSDAPPSLAPLSFAGLGVIGILASLKRFNS
jgi:predicted signal transduction protein with EAL and GGDEF domain